MQKHNVRQSRQPEEQEEREEHMKSQQDIFDPHTGPTAADRVRG